jgi:hypothetical protein
MLCDFFLYYPQEIVVKSVETFDRSELKTTTVLEKQVPVLEASPGSVPQNTELTRGPPELVQHFRL